LFVVYKDFFIYFLVKEKYQSCKNNNNRFIPPEVCAQTKIYKQEDLIPKMIVFYNCKNTFGEKYTGKNEHFHFVHMIRWCPR